MKGFLGSNIAKALASICMHAFGGCKVHPSLRGVLVEQVKSAYEWEDFCDSKLRTCLEPVLRCVLGLHLILQELHHAGHARVEVLVGEEGDLARKKHPLVLLHTFSAVGELRCARACVLVQCSV